MIVFDVKCHVLEPIHVTDRSGRDTVLNPGYYRLRGFEHLVRKVAAGAAEPGTDIVIVSDDNGESFAVTAEKLANFIAYDEVEVTV